MSVIKIFSSKDSFLPFAESCPLKDVRTVEKGAVRNKKTGSVYDAFRVSIWFSSKEWEDLPGQIRDAKRFLKKHGVWVRRAMRGRKIASAYIDFPAESRLSKKIAVQCDLFDAELVMLCSRFKLGIMLSNYG